jgi:hypothetical protein
MASPATSERQPGLTPCDHGWTFVLNDGVLWCRKCGVPVPKGPAKILTFVRRDT